jgi:hypothetical protein
MNAKAPRPERALLHLSALGRRDLTGMVKFRFPETGRARRV